MDKIPDDVLFGCKKWTLFSFCILGIISTFIIIIAGSVATNNADRDKSMTDQDWKTAKRVTIAVIASIGTICMLIEMLGLVGVYKEHFRMTMTFAILMAIITLASIGGAVLMGSFWFTFVVNVLITVLAFLFARDLHRRQSNYYGYGVKLKVTPKSLGISLKA